MAQIEITPFNISGVKVPSNLLDNLLGQHIDYTNLVYPMDLATNPQYCHAVQFLICDYSYPVVEGAYQQLTGLTSNLLSQIGSAYGNISNSILGSSIPNITASGLVSSGKNLVSGLSKSFSNTLSTTSGKEVLNAASSFYNNTNLSAPLQSGLSGLQNITSKAPAELESLFNQYGGLAQPQNWTKRTYEPMASISLYMPDSLVTNFNSNYDQVNLTDTFKIVGYASNATSDVMKSKDTAGSNPSNILAEDIIAGGVAQMQGTKFENLGSLISNAIKKVPNPQVQLLYRGLHLREFQFEFTFTPASQKEAEEVDQIIKTFTYYSLPQLTDSMGGQFFIPPQLFKIKFAFLGDSGAAGQIYDIFKNSLTNLVGNQFTKILTGSNPTIDVAKAKDAKVFHINDCVLKDISVNYAPNGWATYTDGYPVQTTISLTFAEINIVNKNTLQASGDAPGTIVTPANPIPGPINTLFPGGAKTLTDIANGNLPIGVP